MSSDSIARAMPVPGSKRIRDALAEGTRLLQEAGDALARLDAEVLLSEITGYSRAMLLAHGEDELSPQQWHRYLEWIHRRARGEPLAYIIGHTWFYGIRLRVTPDVLVPRPETEVLVEQALRIAKERKGPLCVADVGTGSGAIAVAVGTHMPRARLWATDISARALRVARENVRTHGLHARTLLVQADLLRPLVGPFDLILANLPYVGTEEANVLDPRVRAFEPAKALWAGPTGLDLIIRLLHQARTRLAPDGCILLEVGYRQGERVRQLAREHFPDARVQLHRDLAGHLRVVEIRQEG